MVFRHRPVEMTEEFIEWNRDRKRARAAGLFSEL